jgi:pyruvate,orthophosphate dikinase
VVLLDQTVTHGRDLLGGKAWGIVTMRRLGLPVPPAFVLPVSECHRFHERGSFDDEIWEAVLLGLEHLAAQTGRRFGDPERPLLVSVRSGAPVSMPGMMDTVLNLGITDAVEQALARAAGDPAFARDVHARFCLQFGKVVLGADIDPPAPPATAAAVRAAVRDDVGKDIPDDPFEQLRLAISAVFRSWRSRRATAYRRHWNIPDQGGTAVTIQAMVFGNLDAASGTGVFFTRNPLTGADEPYGHWLPGGQGEDVVSGTHTAHPLHALAGSSPHVYRQLLHHGRVLEREHADVQDIEFTIERGALYLLQTRSAKRSPLAAVRLATALHDEGLIDRAEAIRRVTAAQVAQLLQPALAAEVAAGATVLARGEPACSGVAAGRLVREDEDAMVRGADDPVVLVRPTTSPEDVPAMIAAAAVVTELGGASSHAAVVCRGLGRPCVVGVGESATESWGGYDVTVDGSKGVVYKGRLPVDEVTIDSVPELARLLDWARDLCAVTVTDAANGQEYDLDANVGDEGGQGYPQVTEDGTEALKGVDRVSGSLLTTPEGAAAVIRAGVPTVVALPGQPPLVILLRLLEAQRSLGSR